MQLLYASEIRQLAAFRKQFRHLNIQRNPWSTSMIFFAVIYDIGTILYNLETISLTFEA